MISESLGVKQTQKTEASAGQSPTQVHFLLHNNLPPAPLSGQQINDLAKYSESGLQTGAEEN